MSYCQRCADLEREVADLRRHIERRASGTDPLTEHLRTRVDEAETALRASGPPSEPSEEELDSAFRAFRQDWPYEINSRVRPSLRKAIVAFLRARGRAPGTGLTAHEKPRKI